VLRATCCIAGGTFRAAATRDVISRNVNTTTTTKYPYPQQATWIARPTANPPTLSTLSKNLEI